LIVFALAGDSTITSVLPVCFIRCALTGPPRAGAKTDASPQNLEDESES
jgi:hypothetical protein